MMAAAVAGAVAGGWSLGARADDTALPKAISCSFKDGGAWAFEKGSFVEKPAGTLSFSLTDIDVASQSARLERSDDKDGKAILKIVRAADAHTFIEVAMEGYLNVTTVYRKSADGTYPAVHSRHVAVLGDPLASSYRGTCAAKP
jgi:hypothetical protein